MQEITMQASTTVTCPVCRKEWNVPKGANLMNCNCHLYCEDGDTPSDCTMTPVTFNRDIGWAVGQHGSKDSGCDNILERTYYCSVHGKYTSKRPVVMEVAVPTGRVKPRYRMSEGNY